MVWEFFLRYGEDVPDLLHAGSFKEEEDDRVTDDVQVRLALQDGSCIQQDWSVRVIWSRR